MGVIAESLLDVPPLVDVAANSNGATKLSVVALVFVVQRFVQT